MDGSRERSKNNIMPNLIDIKNWADYRNTQTSFDQRGDDISGEGFGLRVALNASLDKLGVDNAARNRIGSKRDKFLAFEILG